MVQHLADVSQPFFILLAFCLFGGVLLIRVLYASREGISWWFRYLLRAILGFIVGAVLAKVLHLTTQEAWLVCSMSAGVAVVTLKPRSRHIPALIRRKVIARDLKDDKYNSKTHHIDHVWPFSRGGSSSADNLRILTKRENLRKGARKPKIRDLF